jgi:hypothetical protein
MRKFKVCAYSYVAEGGSDNHAASCAKVRYHLYLLLCSLDKIKFNQSFFLWFINGLYKYRADCNSLISFIRCSVGIDLLHSICSVTTA